MVQKKRTLKLRIAGQEYNFRLVGISSHENDYRLVWAVNNHMSIHFTRMPDLVVHETKLHTDLGFSRFQYTDEDTLLTYYLISNSSPDGFLLPELMNIDFLLQITGEADDKQIAVLIREYRKIDIISAVFEIDLKKLKNPGKLLSVPYPG